jgi:hypothetical protein
MTQPTPPVEPMSVRLCIDRVVLSGVAVARPERFAAELSAELERLIGERGWSGARAVSVDRVRLAPLAVGSRGLDARSLAAALHRQLAAPAEGPGRAPAGTTGELPGETVSGQGAAR